MTDDQAEFFQALSMPDYCFISAFQSRHQGLVSRLGAASQDRSGLGIETSRQLFRQEGGWKLPK